MITTRVAMFIGLGVVLTAAVGCAIPPVAPPPDSTLWVNSSSQAADEDGTRAAPFKTIARALANAGQGSVIRLVSGEYIENITLANGVTLEGDGETRPVIRAANAEAPTVTMRGTTALQFVRITGGESGILVEFNANVRIIKCEIVDNDDDGVGFEKPRHGGGKPAAVHIEECVVSGNKDGIDLQSTRGEVIRCRLINNKDDGLDYDGDTDCAALFNEIRDNRDDGIEIRLEKTTLARIEGNTITGNGEDGIEFIDTFVKGPTANRIEVINNTITDNARYGIGGVDHATEEVKQGLLIAGVTLTDNAVKKNRKAQVVGLR